MTDADAIQQAYEDTLAALYKTMLNSYVIAAGDATQQAEADAAFKDGLLLARAVRGKAIALL